MDPAASTKITDGKLSKGVVVLIVVILIIALIVIIYVAVRASNRRKERDQLEAEMAALQSQAADPNTPLGERQGLWSAMSSIAGRLRELRGAGGDSEPANIDIFWSGNGSGICANSGVLNKDRTLKKGVNSMEVCQLQLLLNKKGAGLPVDGKFSANTEAALKMAAANRTAITLRQIPKNYWA